MANICEISGKATSFGNTRSHANNRSNRKVYVNLQNKKIYLPELNAWIRLRASTSSFRTINKKGWRDVFKKAYLQGTLARRLWCLAAW